MNDIDYTTKWNFFLYVLLMYTCIFFIIEGGGGLLFFGGQRKVTKESPLRASYLLYRYTKFNNRSKTRFAQTV